MTPKQCNMSPLHILLPRSGNTKSNMTKSNTYQNTRREAYRKHHNNKATLISIITSVFSAKAQDIHFSQFHAAPVLLNPALTGAFGGEARFIANYRSQWQEIPVPYVTKPFQPKLRFKPSELGAFLELD